MTAANQRTVGRVLIGLALLVIILQALGMLGVIPKLAHGSAGTTLVIVAFLVAVAGGRLQRRGFLQRQ